VQSLHVACAAEGLYDAHSAAMLHSVTAHAGPYRVHVTYLHGPDFPPRSADAIGGMLDGLGASASFIEVDPERLAGLPVVTQFTSAMWYRIFLPELLPDVERVLYLDVDTIVADSLEPLWETDLDGVYLAAVTNVFLREHLHRPASLGLAGPHAYFNSGVLLMNLAEMRTDGCTEALRAYAIESGPTIEWPDQDTLNVVLGTRRRALHPRWNAMNSMRFPWSGEVFGEQAVEEAIRRPGIRHFEGPGSNKPWNYLFEWEDRELYDRHRRETPWPNWKPEDRTPGNVLRRLMRGAPS
jgi:lipopolysaccharide biosynthesis glycosyltransferase